MDMSAMRPLPNSKGHPEVIECMKRYTDAQQAYLGFNEKDPSNFLDNADREEMKARLYKAIEDADKELRSLCQRYNIDYSGLPS